MRKLSFDPEAFQELVAAADWYEQQRRGFAASFLREVDATLLHVRERPGLFARLPIAADLDLRRAVLRRFPYALIFVEFSSEVRVVAVAHTKRRSGYWLGRIREPRDD